MDTLHNSNKRRKTRLISYSLPAFLACLAIGTGVALFSSSCTLKMVDASTHIKLSLHHDGNKQLAAIATSVSIGTLSPSLAAYLSPFGSNVGVEVYELAQQRHYVYNNTIQFLTASSIKVPIMLAFFSLTESQGREPSGDEMNLLTTMIERSDNDAASTLYARINGTAGLSNYLQRIGVSGLIVNRDAWGYSLITPQAMIDLLTKLHTGVILTANDRATALYLMQHVEADQRWGVGDTAPAGATVAQKNGWVPGPDGLWTVNSSGIVSTGGETYLISVYAREQQSMADGQAIMQRVCSTVASALSEGRKN